jgi:hypothetical protein
VETAGVCLSERFCRNDALNFYTAGAQSVVLTACSVIACLVVQLTGRLCVGYQMKSRRAADLRPAVVSFIFHP